MSKPSRLGWCVVIRQRTLGCSTTSLWQLSNRRSLPVRQTCHSATQSTFRNCTGHWDYRQRGGYVQLLVLTPWTPSTTAMQASEKHIISLAYQREWHSFRLSGRARASRLVDKLYYAEHQSHSAWWTHYPTPHTHYSNICFWTMHKLTLIDASPLAVFSPTR